MSKLLESRKSLLGLIVSSVLLLTIFSGCAKLGSTWSATYDVDNFIGRPLTDSDVARLRAFSSYPDSYVSASSKLILGHYYLTNGDKSYAKFLINKSALDPALSSKMKLYSKLWRLDIYILEDDTKSAGAVASEILATPVTQENIAVFETYCNENNIELKENESFKNCIQIRLDKKEMKKRNANATRKAAPMPKPAVPAPADPLKNIDPNAVYGGERDSRYTPPSAPSEPATAPAVADDLTSLETNGVINILDSDISTDYIQGMIYAIEKIEAPYKINSAQMGYKMGETEIGISIDPLSVIVGDKHVYFDIDFDDIVTTISKLPMLTEVDKVVISVPKKRMDQAGYLRDILSDLGKSSTIFNTDNPSYQANLRSMYEADLDKTILNIAIGSDEEVVKFLPIIKYVQTDNTKHKIILGTNSLTISNLTNEYKGYFKDIYVVTPSEQMSNKNMAKFAQNYKNYFGKDITFNNMLGYDMLLYIDNLANNKNAQYLTGIVKIDNGVVYRVNRIYYIDKLQSISEIK